MPTPTPNPRMRPATTRRGPAPDADAFKLIVAPPTWANQAGPVAALLGTLVTLHWLAAKTPGLGLLPYGLALLAFGLYLLASRNRRIEVDSTQVTVRAGTRIQARLATSAVHEVQAGLLCKRLHFEDGRVIRIPDFWENAETVVRFFDRKASDARRTRAGAGVLA